MPQSLEQEMTGGRGTGEQEVGTSYGKLRFKRSGDCLDVGTKANEEPTYALLANFSNCIHGLSR